MLALMRVDSTRVFAQRCVCIPLSAFGMPPAIMHRYATHIELDVDGASRCRPSLQAGRAICQLFQAEEAVGLDLGLGFAYKGCWSWG